MIASLDQELLEAAVELEGRIPVDPAAGLTVELELDETRRLARLLRTAADVVDVSQQQSAGPGPGQERLGLDMDASIAAVLGFGCPLCHADPCRCAGRHRGHIDDSGI